MNKNTRVKAMGYRRGYAAGRTVFETCKTVPPLFPKQKSSLPKLQSIQAVARNELLDLDRDQLKAFVDGYEMGFCDGEDGYSMQGRFA